MARVLVIDDEESICFTFKVFLSAAGHTVESASSYADALKCIEELRPDLIFADILLGGPSGLDLLRTVRERNLAAPFVLMTGDPSVDSAVEAVALGAFQYLCKPVDKDTLLQSTDMALRHKRLIDEKCRLEKEKDALRSHLEAVFNAVPDAIVTVTRDYTVLSANDASRHILGIDPEAAQGKPCVKALGPAAAVCMPLLIEALGGQCIVQHNSAVVGTEPEEVIVDLRAVPLSIPPGMLPDGQEGEDAGVMLMARDMTRIVGLERALEAHCSRPRMVGGSSAMRKVMRLVEGLAHTDTTVLISGESGTGKELVADALHYGGPRAVGPFIKVNCSALSENLLESELFGHVRGAFTGATRGRMGRIQMAHGGTLFLDEIGDISPSVQVKLLRVLQEKVIERVGDVHPVKVDVRVVAATNRNLRELVAQNLFREDLYYRLKVVEVLLPPLRDRHDDVLLLAEYFTKEFNAHFRRDVTGFDHQAQRLMLEYAWPGNVRELRHAVEHAFVMSSGNIMAASVLPAEILQSSGVENAMDDDLAVQDPEQAWENRLDAVLKEAGGNKAKAARILGISRQTIYRKLRGRGM